MALATYTFSRKTVPGGQYFSQVDITGETSYTTGGASIDVTKLGLPANQLKMIVECRPTLAASTVWTPVLIETYSGGIITNLKLMLTVAATGTEVTAATNVSGGIWRFIFAGN